MGSLQGRAEHLAIRWEFPALMLFTWLAFIAIPLSLGQIGISWDALNHQIYLGWSAESPRFDLDFLAASYQSSSFPTCIGRCTSFPRVACQVPGLEPYWQRCTGWLPLPYG